MTLRVAECFWVGGAELQECTVSPAAVGAWCLDVKGENSQQGPLESSFIFLLTYVFVNKQQEQGEYVCAQEKGR